MKNVTSYIKNIFVLLPFAFFLASCSDYVGLGEAVDLSAPEVSITNYSDNDTVPSEFTLIGTAYDNTAVTELYIDFDAQNLHYKLESDDVWYKKNGSATDWQKLEAAESSFVRNGKTCNWSIYVKTEEGSKAGNSYTLSAIVYDAQKNSGKKSKQELSLIVDTENPDVSIYKPELLTGLYTNVLETAKEYSLKDGSIISKLFNGDITLTGRQSGSIDFKELRIDFDSGELYSGTRLVTGGAQAYSSVDEIAKNVKFDEEAPTVYFSKTYKLGDKDDSDKVISDLRNWEFTIKQSEWVTASKNSELLKLGTSTGSGKIIRIVSTSLSPSNAWEKKVIGYFVWWPEADIPWITTYIGDETFAGEENTYPVYPSSNFSGTVQDDDGIKKLEYEVRNGDNWEAYSQKKEISISEEGTTYSAFTIKNPTENGTYQITLTATDIYGTTTQQTRYVRTLDVTPPKINITAPVTNTAVLDSNSDSNGNITFSGTVSDDGSVNSLVLIHLNPIANDFPENIIRYMSGSEDDWNLVSASKTSVETGSYTNEDTTYKNKVFYIPLTSLGYNSETNSNEYSFSKKINLFTDLGINAKTKPLINQYFVLRAVDNGGTKTVSQITLSGDAESPELTLTSIQQFDASGNKKIEKFNLTGSSVPTFAVVKEGDYAILTGTFKDNSFVKWNNNAARIPAINFTWGDDAQFAVTKSVQNDDSWAFTAKVTSLPTTSKPLTVSLSDYAANTKTVTKSIFIETAELGITSIGAETDDGSYNAGKTIKIILNFTKNTVVDTSSGTPYLELNNGGKATYKTGGESGNATSQHIFEYTVASSDKDTAGLNTNGTLDVKKLVTNGAVYKDASVSGGSSLSDDDLALPSNASQTLGGGRNIKIDKTAPKIASFKAISSAGYYNAEKSVLFLLTFNENVTITNASSLGLKFSQFTPATVTAESSGSNVIFTYTVKSGETSTTPLTLSGITNTSGVTITDEAGNKLTDWSCTSSLGANIYIDTTAPAAPTISGNWGDAKLVTTETYFTLSNTESGATVEYSIDGGKNYQAYSSKVTLSNNGTYIIKARQTDRAGNVSAVASGGSITVEKGDFLNKITADTVSGTYSVNKGGKVLGRLIFRKDITLPTGSYVTLNAKNSGGTFYTCSLTKASSATISGGCDYTFTYTISDGDFIGNNATLNVTSWNFSSVTYKTGISEVGDISYSLPYSSTVTSGKAFKDNRTIYILTGVPELQSAILGGTIASDGTVTGEKLTLTFDRTVTKVSGNIVLSLDGDAYSDSYIAPAVIAESDYSTAFDSYYTAGLNGATLNSDSTLTNDNTTKRVLNYSVEPTNSDLLDLFKENGWNKVEIPVVSSAVLLSTDGKTVTVDLSDSYKLPVKGAKYKLTIPAGTFSDSVQNKNTAYAPYSDSTGLTAVGVEPPVIRINKGSQEIKPGAAPNYTKNATVTMPVTAKMRIDCQTPGASIYYDNADKTTSDYTVVQSNYDYKTKEQAAKTIPTVKAPSTLYSGAQTLGDTISGYTTAVGQKFAISAYAIKGSVTSPYSYEYATRTVLKLKITGGYKTNNYGYSNDSDGYYTTSTNITEGSALTFGNLRVWVMGGDSTYGGNSITPFPLSWHDSSDFKLMAGSFTSTSTMDCTCYWVSWDITTATYHGFVIGDVPPDAAENGPTQWYSGEGGWDSQKGNYALYPGETLEMHVSGNQLYSNGSFHWRTKNHGSRS